jgi:hypothetical protein
MSEMDNLFTANLDAASGEMSIIKKYHSNHFFLLVTFHPIKRHRFSLLGNARRK